jgi:hypothetical protein
MGSRGLDARQQRSTPLDAYVTHSAVCGGLRQMSLANHASRLTATHFCNKIGTEQTKPLPLDVRQV